MFIYLNSTISRIKKFIDFKGLTFSEFERTVGVSHSLFSRAFKNETSIGSDKIEKIHSVYPELNMGWVITGEGAMLSGEQVEPKAKSSDSSDLLDRLERLAAENALLKAKVSELEARKDRNG